MKLPCGHDVDLKSLGCGATLSNGTWRHFGFCPECGCEFCQSNQPWTRSSKKDFRIESGEHFIDIEPDTGAILDMTALRGLDGNEVCLLVYKKSGIFAITDQEDMNKICVTQIWPRKDLP